MRLTKTREVSHILKAIHGRDSCDAVGREVRGIIGVARSRNECVDGRFSARAVCKRRWLTRALSGLIESLGIPKAHRA